MTRRQQYIEEALAAYQVAGQYRALGMRTGLLEFAELSKLYIERAWRFERYANELPANEVKPVVEENKEMHPISRLITLFVILLLVLSMGSVSAQDVPLETNTPDVIEGTATLVSSTEVAPTAEVTPVPEPEQPPVVVVEQPDDNTLYVLGFLLFAGVTGLHTVLSDRRVSSLLTVVTRVMDNQQTLNEAQRRYSEASLPTQEFVKLLGGVATFVGASNIPGIDPFADKFSEYLNKVTAGLPPEVAAEIRAHAALSVAVPNTPGNQG